MLNFLTFRHDEALPRCTQCGWIDIDMPGKVCLGCSNGDTSDTSDDEAALCANFAERSFALAPVATEVIQ